MGPILQDAPSNSPKLMHDTMDDGHLINWVSRPLDWEDLLAALSLLSLGLTSLIVYSVVMKIMKNQDKEIVGYRFLVSIAFADVLLLVNYAIWPAITILAKSEIVTSGMRHWIQIYLDWAWFSMVSHYSIIGWSRWMAIYKPHAFRMQTKLASYTICGCCYILALIVVLSTHFQPWYVTFYYEPSNYGMLAEDFPLYMTGGQSAMFLIYHVIAIIPPTIFYGWTFYLLYQRRKSHTFRTMVQNQSSLQSSIESRLLIPCVINLLFFIVGQVLITWGTGEGKWAGFLVMLIFSLNSAVNPILLLMCSNTLRRQFLELLGFRTTMIVDKIEASTIFSNHVKKMTGVIRDKQAIPLCDHIDHFTTPLTVNDDDQPPDI